MYGFQTLCIEHTDIILKPVNYTSIAFVKIQRISSEHFKSLDSVQYTL